MGSVAMPAINYTLTDVMMSKTNVSVSAYDNDNSDTWFLFDPTPAGSGTTYLFIFVGTTFSIYKYDGTNYIMLFNGGAYLKPYSGGYVYSSSAASSYTYVYAGEMFSIKFSLPDTVVDPILAGLTKGQSYGRNASTGSYSNVKSSAFSPCTHFFAASSDGLMEVGEFLTHDETISPIYSTVLKIGTSVLLTEEQHIGTGASSGTIGHMTTDTSYYYLDIPTYSAYGYSLIGVY